MFRLRIVHIYNFLRAFFNNGLSKCSKLSVAIGPYNHYIITHNCCFVNVKIALYKFGNVCYNKGVGIPPRG